jgi:hypothetical protein
MPPDLIALFPDGRVGAQQRGAHRETAEQRSKIGAEESGREAVSLHAIVLVNGVSGAVEQDQSRAALADGIEREDIDSNQHVRLASPFDDGVPVGFGDALVNRSG